jgi:hypothetical protein
MSDESNAAEDALARKFGAKSLAIWPPGSFGGRSVAGFVFDGEGDHPGFRQKRSGGEAYYVPHRGTKIGRQAAREADALRLFTASTHIVGALSAERHALVGNKMCWSAAGIYGRQIVLVVPAHGDCEPYQPPPMLREIKRSEFIAITEEQTEAPESAAA